MQDSQPPTCNLWHILIHAFASSSSKKRRDKTIVTGLILIFEFLSSYFLAKIIWKIEIYFNIQALNIQIKTNKHTLFTNYLHNSRTQNLMIQFAKKRKWNALLLCSKKNQIFFKTQFALKKYAWFKIFKI
jgi:hypothetical protein